MVRPLMLSAAILVAGAIGITLQGAAAATPGHGTLATRPTTVSLSTVQREVAFRILTPTKVPTGMTLRSAVLGHGINRAGNDVQLSYANQDSGFVVLEQPGHWTLGDENPQATMIGTHAGQVETWRNTAINAPMVAVMVYDPQAGGTYQVIANNLSRSATEAIAASLFSTPTTSQGKDSVQYR